MRTALEAAIPHGRSDNGGSFDRGAWRRGLPARVATAWTRHADDYATLVAKHPKLGRGIDANHLGTLGTGNHFIEVCLDEREQVWVMLHSGSRGTGNLIGSYFIEQAR